MISITYTFTLEDGSKEIFPLKLNTQTVELEGNEPTELPDWVALDFHQCSNCPLKSKDHPQCPLSVSLVDLVNRFEHIISYDRVHLSVELTDKTISQETSAQRGVSSLMGLLIATSGCPHTEFFKPMARFHFPLADPDETLSRSTSMYLLAQYFLKKAGKEFDLSLGGLSQIYKNIDLVNDHIADRLRHASKSDSTVNAIVLLDLFAKTIPMTIDESLDEIEHVFKAFIEHSELFSESSLITGKSAFVKTT